MWYIYTMEYYAAEKNNDFMKFARKWMELENVIVSEIIVINTGRIAIIKIRKALAFNKQTFELKADQKCVIDIVLMEEVFSAPIAVIKHRDTFAREAFIPGYSFTSQFITEEHQGRNPWQKTRAAEAQKSNVGACEKVEPLVASVVKAVWVHNKSEGDTIQFSSSLRLTQDLLHLLSAFFFPLTPPKDLTEKKSQTFQILEENECAFTPLENTLPYDGTECAYGREVKSVLTDSISFDKAHLLVPV
ncbi:hypothetical protein STEG23_024666 [Scotinomys teguina]